jgi:hypothetical protein
MTQNKMVQLATRKHQEEKSKWKDCGKIKGIRDFLLTDPNKIK